jgi:hypothetical protein
VTDMRDELLEQVVDELRTLPPVDETAVQRIVRAAAEEARPGGMFSRERGRRGGRPLVWWRSPVPLAAAAVFALAAGVGGYLAGEFTHRDGQPVAASPAESLALASAVRPAAHGPLPSEVLTQFVLNAPSASRVSLVGDFNAWDTNQTPLVRDPSSGIWTAMVPLPPGRHVYAFMVDGTKLTLDPRAPTAHDPDFGTPSSVVLVGTP